uniref:Predicted protein n=1 Tax=Hordeum vulgare subsp. vulgare TaxID=112509 RepID=F2EG05_HORVV|nr:predicted protein [Hordeum vulgare subsp. vulgare]
MCNGKPGTASAGPHQPPAPSGRRAPHPGATTEHRVRSPLPSTVSAVRASTPATGAAGHRVWTSTPASVRHHFCRQWKALAMAPGMSRSLVQGTWHCFPFPATIPHSLYHPRADVTYGN